jgi:hypothetical protein
VEGIDVIQLAAQGRLACPYFALSDIDQGLFNISCKAG